ncbi:MAG: hypothetical protein KBT15_10760 [Bacteroidales bacterium]|nr:hypothetical protein [Candidatus Minthousia equi]
MMKKIIFLLLMLPMMVQAQQMYASRMGVMPNTEKDCAEGLKAILNKCKQQKAKQLILLPGVYHIHSALVMKDMKNFEVVGNNTTLVFHDTPVAIELDNCKKITFKNINFTYDEPKVTELTILEKDAEKVVAQINENDPYYVINGRFGFQNKELDKFKDLCVLYIPDLKQSKATDAWNLLHAQHAKMLGNGKLEFSCPEKFSPAAGSIIKVRNARENQEVIRVMNAKKTTLVINNVGFHHIEGQNLTQYNVKKLKTVGL